MLATNSKPYPPAASGAMIHSLRRPQTYLARLPINCSTCGMRMLCLAGDMRSEDLAKVDTIITTRKRIRRGEYVYRAGDPFSALFAFRTGFFKSYVESEDGRTHVTSFQMAGDITGFDGIEGDRYTQSVVALEDGDACTITYAQIESVSERVPGFQHHVFRVMSREIVREQKLMMLLGTMRAEARVAHFILSLAQRFAARGYSSIEFNLRMTREEIGSYLGLKLETVSRLFSRFQEEGLIQVQGRAIKLLDTAALRDLAGERSC